MSIKRIMCCCASGLGSSLLMRMNVERALKRLGHEDVEVHHASLADATAGGADLFVVSGKLDKKEIHFPRTLELSDIMSDTELEEKLNMVFQEEG